MSRIPVSYTHLDVYKRQFEAFSKPQQMAFLINAYNAFTVELILTRYPQLESIRDLGGVFSKPWSIRNVPLLGRMMTLDEIEHDTLLSLIHI